MATYRERPDGLLEVTNEAGTFPVALSPEQLEAHGVVREPTLAERGATAGLDPNLAAAMAQSWLPLEPSAQQQAAIGQRQTAPRPPEIPELVSDESTWRNSPLAGLPESPPPLPRDTYQAAALQAAGVERDANQRAQTVAGFAPESAPGGQMTPGQALAQDYLASQMRGTYVPGREARDVRMGFQRQVQAPLDEDTQGAMRDAQERKYAAAEVMTDRASEAMARAREAERETLEARDVNLAIARDEQRQKAERLAVLAQVRDQRKREVQSINPERFWEQTGGIGRVLAAISIALGGYVQGVRGGENPGLAIIRDAINEDIEGQRAVIEGQERRAAGAESDYLRLLDAYGDPLMAEEQLRIEQLEVLKGFAQTRINRAEDDATRAAAEQMLADLDLEQQEAQARWDGRAGVMTETWQHDPGRKGGRTKADPLKALKDAAEIRELGDKLYGADGGELSEQEMARVVRLPSGQRTFAKDAKAADEAQEFLQASSAYDHAVGEIEEIVRNSFGRTLQPSQLGRINALRAVALKHAKAQAGSFGGLSDDERRIFLEPISGAGAGETFSIDSRTLSQLEKARELNRRNVRDAEQRLYTDKQLRQPLIPTDTVRRQGSGGGAAW